MLSHLCASCQVIEYNPSQCLDWLAVQTPRNKLAHSWVLQNMENWVERFLLAHNYPRVRTCKGLCIVSLYLVSCSFFLTNTQQGVKPTTNEKTLCQSLKRWIKFWKLRTLEAKTNITLSFFLKMLIIKLNSPLVYTTQFLLWLYRYTFFLYC